MCKYFLQPFYKNEMIDDLCNLCFMFFFVLFLCRLFFVQYRVELVS